MDHNDPSDPVRHLVDGLAATLTEERTAQLRRLAGMTGLPKGGVADVLAGREADVERLLIGLMATVRLKERENQAQASRIRELEEGCAMQARALDAIHDEVMRLHLRLASILPETQPAGAFARLKAIAEGAGQHDR